VAGESLALYAGLPLTGLVLLVIIVIVLVLLRRQIAPTAGGMLIYANLCHFILEPANCNIRPLNH